jgi:hypothetical protein
MHVILVETGIEQDRVLQRGDFSRIPACAGMTADDGVTEGMF